LFSQGFKQFFYIVTGDGFDAFALAAFFLLERYKTPLFQGFGGLKVGFFFIRRGCVKAGGRCSLSGAGAR
jgi:hypothetical protein